MCKLGGIAASVGTVGLVGGGTYAALKLAGKTGKTLGATGSIAHITTNQNMTAEDKKAALKEINKEGLKDSAKFLGLTAATAGTAALVAGVSKTAQGKLASFVSKVGSALNSVSINGTTVKESIKNSGIGKAFLNATPAAKAAVLVATAAVAVAGPLFNLCQAAKAGYIEGQHESK